MCHWSGTKMASETFPGIPFNITGLKDQPGYMPCYTSKEAAMRDFPDTEIMIMETLEKTNENS